MNDAAKAAERLSVEQMCRNLLGQATIDGVIDYHGEPNNIRATDLTGMANLLTTYLTNLVRHQKREAEADARRDRERLAAVVGRLRNACDLVRRWCEVNQREKSVIYKAITEALSQVDTALAGGAGGST